MHSSLRSWVAPWALSLVRPWPSRRGRRREIAAHVKTLQDQGAERIVLAGHSMGMPALKAVRDSVLTWIPAAVAG